jgi:hypothetical protein
MAIAASANRRFQFRNRNQLIIRAHNTPLPVARYGRQQSRLFALHDPPLKRSPNSNRVS